MHPERDQAIVLRSVPFGERHRIVTALTKEHGQISAMARNSIQSRRFGGTLDVFAASEWLFTSKPGADLCQLSEALSLEAFEGIRSSFEKLSLASILNEVMLKISPQNESCFELFQLHSNALAAINQKVVPTQKVGTTFLLNAYLGKVLQWSGNQPRIQSCLHCGLGLENLDPFTELTCLVVDAAWICDPCRRTTIRHIQDQGHGEGQFNSIQQMQLKIRPIALHDFQMSLCTPIRKVSALAKGSLTDHQDLFKFLEALFTYHIPGFDKHPLKSLRFLGLESTAQPGSKNFR